MSDHYTVDYETYSRAKLKAVGSYRYASDPSTQILLCAVARGDEAPLVWDSYAPDGADNRENCEALLLLQEAVDSGAVIYAHNAPFEIAITKHLWKKTFGFDPPALEQWRCTMAMARRAAMPSGLDDLGEALKLRFQKDKKGEQLIKIFCVPRSAGKLKGNRIMPDDEGTVTVQGQKVLVSEAWEMFREYCRQDVVTEQEVLKSLKPFDLKGTTLKSFQFDLRMNERGLPVNREGLKKAHRIVEEASKLDIARCQEICGMNPTQVQALLPWLKKKGYPGEDLREETMEKALGSKGMTPLGREVLEIRSRVAFSAVKKIPTMLKVAGKDGRVRGCLMWSGAIRTHRWSGKIIQPQNFKRPTIKDTHGAYKHICSGWDHEMISMVYGNPVEVVASCIRHFIHDPDYQFLDADYSNIEARIVPWLAGQESLLDAFRAGIDPYVLMASKVYKKPEVTIKKDERFVGKQLILGAGYNLGWEKFQAMCAKFGQTVDDETCKMAIDVYREENPQIRSLWKSMQRAAVDAVENPGFSFTVRGKIVFQMAQKLSFPALIMRLPSGHRLIYPDPKLQIIWMFQKKKYPNEFAAIAAYNIAKRKGTLEEGDRVWQTRQITFFGPDPLSKKWGRRSTYGGSLTENASQAIAGDFITHGAMQAEKAGYDVFSLIHDQALATYRPDKGNTVDGFRDALCTLPPWALDFPLKAESGITNYYQKD